MAKRKQIPPRRRAITISMAIGMTCSMLQEAWGLRGNPSAQDYLREDLGATSQSIRSLGSIIESYFSEFTPYPLRPDELDQQTTVRDLATAIWNRVPNIWKTTSKSRKTKTNGVSQTITLSDAEEGSGLGLVGEDGIERDIQRKPTSKRGNKKYNRRGRLYSVWFGTDRRPVDKKNVSKGFANERGDRTVLGRVDVLIPKSHRFGETGNSFWKRLKRLDLRDDHLSVESIRRFSESEFWASMRHVLQDVEGDNRNSSALIFIHGYQTDFREAACRAAQIGFDLKISGGMAFFSWPSCNSITGYAADEATIESSEKHITNFIVDFVQKSGALKVHVLAHSMGNRGLLRALQRIAGDAELRTGVRLGQLFLAAPDIDRDVFCDLAFHYGLFAERTTLYASDGDKAVYLSAIHHRNPRAGYYLPYTIVEGVDTVVVPNFRIDMLGHSYYAKASAMLNDIYDLVRNNTPPEKRQRIESIDHNNQPLWRIAS